MELILKNTLKNGVFDNVSLSRTRIMRSIKGKHNKSTEVRLRMALVKAGLKGWALHPQHIFGKPDIFFVKKKLAIFVDGCFWHGCKSCGHIPRIRSMFWKTKFERNQKRDKVVKFRLNRGSIEVMRIWEHELREPTRIKQIVKVISSH